MTHEDMKRISAIQLKIMDEVHRLCMENNITYYMIGGTLLGAVRHGGYIPWDVDIDIAMPREDYEVFEKICKTLLSENYDYVNYKTFRNYIRPHALVTHTGSRIHPKYDCVNPKLMDLGIYIDIFPLDNAPEDGGLQKKHAESLLRLRKFKDRRLMYCYSYSRLRRYIHYMVAALLSWISVERINEYQQKLMQKYREEQTGYLCSMGSRYKYEKQCMPREIYGQPVLLDFEGRQYYAPAQYEEYLRRLYGDYMRLPSVEEQQANLELYTSVEFL